MSLFNNQSQSQSQTQGGGLFGAPQQNASILGANNNNKSGGLFGNSSNPTNISFGANNTTGGNSLFGANTSSNQLTFGPNNSGNNQNSQQGSLFSFNNKGNQSNNLFGSGNQSTNLFGQNNNSRESLISMMKSAIFFMWRKRLWKSHLQTYVRCMMKFVRIWMRFIWS